MNATAEASIREQMRQHQDRWNGAVRKSESLQGCTVLVGCQPDGPFATMLDLVPYEGIRDDYLFSAVYYPADANGVLACGMRVWIVVVPIEGPAHRQCCDVLSCTGGDSGHGAVRISAVLRAVAPRETFTAPLLEFGAIKPARLVIPGYNA